MARPVARSVAVLCCLVPACPGAAPAVQEDALGAAIARGVEWVMEHPATAADGGFPDLLDEALFFSVLARLAPDPDERARYRRAFEDRAARLAPRSPGPPQPALIAHYHRLLAAHLADLAGRPLPGRATLVADARRALARSPMAHPTFRLTVGLLLGRLGASPGVPPEELLEAGLVARLSGPGGGAAKGPAPPPHHPLTYYALVHEVAALTDFGRLPPPAWLRARRDALAAVFREGVRLARESGEVDLLAELLLGSHLLGVAPAGELRAGVESLVASQEPDGSWGPQRTPRANPRRHAVQTAVAALMAWRGAWDAE
jgi:hypothetical protein